MGTPQQSLQLHRLLCHSVGCGGHKEIAVFVLVRELGSLAGNENIHCCYCWLFPVVVAGWAAVMNIYWP